MPKCVPLAAYHSWWRHTHAAATHSPVRAGRGPPATHRWYTNRPIGADGSQNERAAADLRARYLVRLAPRIKFNPLPL